jgi:hypothetical protein
VPTIIATPGSSVANSYETHAEANAFFDERIPLNPPWLASGEDAVLIMACRALNTNFQPSKRYVPGEGNNLPHYVQRRTWTGWPATTTQVLPWPRAGMYDWNGNPIPSDVIPQALKDAQSEMAGQLLAGDRTLDNDVIVQGLTSVRAGSVSLGFKQTILPQVVPDAVLNLIPPSWLTDEIITSVYPAIFEVV